MSLIIEDRLLRTPQLWILGKKPTSPVKIDWSHPLTDGLVGFFLTNHMGAPIINLVNNEIGVLNGSLGNLSRGAGPNGACLDNSYTGASSSDYYVFSDILGGKPGYLSHIAHIDLHVDAVRFGLYSAPRSGGSEHTTKKDTTSYLAVWVSTGGNYKYYQQTYPDIPESIQTLSSRFSYPNTGVVYYNGVAQTPDSSTELWSGSVFDTPDEFRIFRNYTYQGTSGKKTHLYCQIFINKDIGEANLKSLEADPYQFLVPA